MYQYFFFSLIIRPPLCSFFFFFNDTATTEIYTLSLHDALPIYIPCREDQRSARVHEERRPPFPQHVPVYVQDRKSTRLNSSHSQISYAVFCLKKKKNKQDSHPMSKKITRLAERSNNHSSAQCKL